MSLIGRVGWDDKRARGGKNGEMKIPLKNTYKPLQIDARLTVGINKTQSKSKH